MSWFEGKTFLVTGAARGIGRATAEVLAERGSRLAIIDRDEARLTDVTARLRELTDVVSVLGDVADPDDVTKVFSAGLEAFGGYDGLANNAGIIGQAAPIQETSLEAYQNIMRVNTQSAFLFLREYVGWALGAGRTGSVVFTGSTSGMRGAPNLISYSASKQAIAGITRSAAAELGKHNIRVNAVAPGRIDTGFMDMFESREAAQAGLESRPLSRIADPREVAYLIAWLLSDEASFATGAIYPIDGGFTV